MTKNLILAVSACILIVAGSTGLSLAAPVQQADLTANNGYHPDLFRFEAGLPARLNIHTGNAFDCSADLVIPALNYHKHLPPAEVTVIDIPAQPAGTRITGTCSMGMYSFLIVFDETPGNAVRP